MPTIKWNAALYDSKHSFVSKYGEDLVGWLHPLKGERILDLGCGTGQLTNDIAGYGAEVIGIDNSPEMIAKAKASYPGIRFEIKNATNFSFEQPFDAIFSNATFHWINEPEKVIGCMYQNLKDGGRIAIEFGGKGNVQVIADAIKLAMKEEGFADKIVKDFWYFPSIGEYAVLLEQQGFRVTSALHFDRPTQLVGEDGMRDWINMFGSFFFKNISTEQSEKVMANAITHLRKTNYHDNTWFADYIRIRIKAIKQTLA